MFTLFVLVREPFRAGSAESGKTVSFTLETSWKRRTLFAVLNCLSGAEQTICSAVPGQFKVSSHHLTII
jgi:hypothetical protein